MRSAGLTDFLVLLLLIAAHGPSSPAALFSLLPSLPITLLHSSPAAALPANNSASRVYTRSISSDLWPVGSQPFIKLAPRFPAVVTRPDRKLCPPKVAGSKPSLA